MMNNQTMTLPKNFAPVTDEEMMYLDGGVTHTGSYIKGFTTIYSAKECKAIVNGIDAGLGLTAAIGIVASKNIVSACVVAFVGVALTSARYMFKKGSQGHGLKKFYQSIPFSGNINTTTYL